VEGSALIWDQVVEMCQTHEKRPLTPAGMVEAFHGEELAVDGAYSTQSGCGALLVMQSDRAVWMYI
jgi:hypothetical protein